MIIVNFKRYPEASGDRAVALAKVCLQIQQETGVTIVPVPQAKDLAACVALGIKCWTQRFEANESLQKGTLLNHSDYRLEKNILKEEYYLSGSRGDKICICAASLPEAKELVSYKPDFLGYEPPEFIGSKTMSVADAKPEVIGLTAQACKEAGVPLLVGAGIKSANDIKISLKMGAVGVLVATDIVLAVDPAKELRELALAFNMKA